MFTPGDLPAVLGGCGTGHLWIGASFQTDQTAPKGEGEEEFKGDEVKGGGGFWLFLPTV